MNTLQCDAVDRTPPHSTASEMTINSSLTKIEASFRAMLLDGAVLDCECAYSVSTPCWLQHIQRKGLAVSVCWLRH